MSEITDQDIVDAAQFKRMKAGDKEKENFSPLELQKAQQAQAAATATTGGRRGLIINKLRPPGSI